MVMNLRSGREFENRKEDEKRKIEKEKQAEIEEEIKLSSSEKTDDRRKKKVYQDQSVEERNLKKKEKVQEYMPSVHFLKGCKEKRWKSCSLNSWKCLKR